MKFWKTFCVLCLTLTMILSMAACTGSQDPTTPSTEAPTSEAALSTGEATEPNAIPADGSELGEGQHSFTFQVQMADGTAYHYTVHTDEETVGAALVDLGLLHPATGEDLAVAFYGPIHLFAQRWLFRGPLSEAGKAAFRQAAYRHVQRFFQERGTDAWQPS